MKIALEAQTKWAFHLREEYRADKYDIAEDLLADGISEDDLSRLPETIRVKSNVSYRWGTVELELPEERFIEMLLGHENWGAVDEYIVDWDLEGGETVSLESDDLPDDIADVVSDCIEINGDIDDSKKRLDGKFKVTGYSGITDPVLTYWLSSVASSGESCEFDTNASYPMLDLCEQVSDCELQRAAEMGDVEAQVCLAETWASAAENSDLAPLSKLFDLKTLSLSQAIMWYLRAAELDDERAQIALAEMHDKGLGVDRNAAEALSWYLKAAKKGDPLAQATAAVMYERGDGTEKNHIEALKWFRKAAEQDFPEAEDHANLILEQLAEAVIREANGKS